MASLVLYPPVIDAKMPTFSADQDSVKVYFSISDFNTLNNFARIGYNSTSAETIAVGETTFTTSTPSSTSGSNYNGNYSEYKSEEEKLYHLFLNNYKEKGWRRFYCAAPYKYIMNGFPSDPGGSPPDTNYMLRSATLGPMFSYSDVTPNDLGIDNTWTPTKYMLIDHSKFEPGELDLGDGQIITDDYRVLLPNNREVEAKFENSYKPCYVYPDMKAMKEMLEKINTGWAASVEPDKDNTPVYIKYSARAVSGSNYSGEALIPSAAANDQYTHYAYPWTMVSCTDLQGENQFRDVTFSSDYPLKDSGIHFYTMYRDEEKYNKGETDCYYIILNKEELKYGFSPKKFYQIQIRFLDKNIKDNIATGGFPSEDTEWMRNNIDFFSEWSSVCLLKSIYQPFVRLDDEIENILYNESGAYFFTGAIFNSHFLTIRGNIDFTQDESGSIEQLYQINFVLVDDEFNEIENSGWLNKDEVVDKDSDKLNSFIYMFKRRYSQNKLYHLYINYKTNNGFQDCNFSFRDKYQLDGQLENISEEDAPIATVPYADIKVSVLSELHKVLATIDAVPNDNDGQVLVRIQTSVPFNGRVMILRTSSITNYEEWEPVVTINNIDSIDKIYWIDRTIQSDQWYKYAAIFREKFTFNKRIYDADTMYYKPITRTLETDIVYEKYPVGVFLDDSFLIGNYKQLKVKFDPQVNSFKWKVTESSVETLGNKYPFFNRNAAVNYRTFPISGTISCWMDDEENFGLRDDFFASFELPYHMNQVQKYDIEAHQDWLLEKRFRDAVAAFLMDVRPKLFKSLTEGNILIKLHDVSFSPNKVLGRRIWSFSGTATEIEECSVKNIDKYNIQKNRIDLQFLPNTDNNTFTLKYENDEDLSVTPEGFFILHDVKAKALTQFLIGEKQMKEYGIRLSRPINSDIEGNEVNKLDIVEHLFADMREDN